MANEDARDGNELRTASTVVLAIDVVGILVLALAGLCVQPRFVEMFAEMEIELPLITKFLLSIPPAVYVVLCSSLILALVLKEVLIQANATKLTVNIIVGVGELAYLCVYVIALILPSTKLM